MAAPPGFEGAVHDRLIFVGPSAIAVSDVGAFGAVVALAVLEKGPTPPTLIAATR